MLVRLPPNKKDRAHINALRKRGALKRIKTHKLPKGGSWKCVCCDGHSTPEQIRFHSKLSRKANGGLVCTQLCTILGGPAAISQNSPIADLKCGSKSVNVASWVDAHIEGALQVKGPSEIQSVFLVAHFPCGMMMQHNLSVVDNLRYSFEAKDDIRGKYVAFYKGLKVPVFRHVKVLLQVLTRKGKFRTYLVERRMFYDYCDAIS